MRARPNAICAKARSRERIMWWLPAKCVFEDIIRNAIKYVPFFVSSRVWPLFKFSSDKRDFNSRESLVAHFSCLFFKVFHVSISNSNVCSCYRPHNARVYPFLNARAKRETIFITYWSVCSFSATRISEPVLIILLLYVTSAVRCVPASLSG